MKWTTLTKPLSSASGSLKLHQSVTIKQSFEHNGVRINKMRMIKQKDYIQVWVGIGDSKSCGIRLDDEAVEIIIGFLKNKY